jgi:hypothetical protein
VLGCELTRQTPAHAGIAEVVDDAAENVPARVLRHVATFLSGNKKTGRGARFL